MYKKKHQFYQSNGLVKTIETFEGKTTTPKVAPTTPKATTPKATTSNSLPQNVFPSVKTTLFDIYDTKSKATSGLLRIDRNPMLTYTIYYDDTRYLGYFVVINNIRYNLTLTADGGPRILIFNSDGEEYIDSNRLTYINIPNPTMVNLSAYETSPIKSNDLLNNNEPINYKSSKKEHEQLFTYNRQGSLAQIIAPIFGDGENAVVYFYITFVCVVLFIILLLLL